VSLREPCDCVAVGSESAVPGEQYRFRVGATDSRERALKIARARDLDYLRLYPEGHGIRPHLLGQRGSGWLLGFTNTATLRKLRSRLLEELQQLARGFVGEVARAGDVATGFL